MRRVLLVQTRPGDPLAEVVAANEALLPDTEVRVVDLAFGEPDYAALLKEILAADQVQVW